MILYNGQVWTFSKIRINVGFVHLISCFVGNFVPNFFAHFNTEIRSTRIRALRQSGAVFFLYKTAFFSSPYLTLYNRPNAYYRPRLLFTPLDRLLKHDQEKHRNVFPADPYLIYKIFLPLGKPAI